MSQQDILLSMKIKKEMETYRKQILQLDKEKIFNKSREIQLIKDFAGVFESSYFEEKIVNRILKKVDILSFIIENYDDDELTSNHKFNYVKHLFN